MSPAKLWAIARAETRIIQGQLLYWLFVAAAYWFTVTLFIQQGLLHALYSTRSSTVDVPAAGASIFIIAHYYLIIFLLAMVFFALDIRGRDGRVRILEILDSRPYSNLDLVFGRFVGWLLCAWIPIIILMLLIMLLGW